MPAAPILALPPVIRQDWRVGLRGAAREAAPGTYLGPSSEEGQRIGGGISYTPEMLGTANSGSFDPCVNPEHVFTQRDGQLTFLSWAVYVWEDCAVLGGSGEDVRQRAVDRLERQTSHLVEQALWTGTLTDGSSSTLETLASTVTPTADNVRLMANVPTSTLIDGGAAHDLTVALGLITEWAAEQAGGERVWVHAPVQALPFLAFYDQATRTSSRGIGTALGDHVVVAGTGYTGGPDEQATGANEIWLAVTTPVRFIEGPIEVPVDPVQYVDRSINRYRAVAQRAVLAEWDLTLHGLIKVCLPPPGPDCETVVS